MNNKRTDYITGRCENIKARIEGNVIIFYKETTTLYGTETKDSYKIVANQALEDILTLNELAEEIDYITIRKIINGEVGIDVSNL